MNCMHSEVNGLGRLVRACALMRLLARHGAGPSHALAAVV